MSEGPWIRFFPSDWLAGTRGMSAAETGIYITLIAMMYERGEPIADDRPRLARLCGTTPAALRSTLDLLIDHDKIEIIDGGLWNNKVGVETEFRREKSGSARAAADKRWQKRKQKQRKPDAAAMPEQCGGNASQNHIPEDASQAQHLTPTRAEIDKLENQCREAAGAEQDISPGLFVMAPILGLIASGHDLELDILPTIRAVSRRAKRRPSTWDYYTAAIREASAKRRGLAAGGLSPPIEGSGGNVFERLKRGLNDGSIRDGRGDGPTVDAVRSLPDLRGEPEQRDDGESVLDRDRRMHAGRSS